MGKHTCVVFLAIAATACTQQQDEARETAATAVQSAAPPPTVDIVQVLQSGPDKMKTLLGEATPAAQDESTLEYTKDGIEFSITYLDDRPLRVLLRAEGYPPKELFKLLGQQGDLIETSDRAFRASTEGSALRLLDSALPEKRLDIQSVLTATNRAAVLELLGDATQEHLDVADAAHAVREGPQDRFRPWAPDDRFTLLVTYHKQRVAEVLLVCDGMGLYDKEQARKTREWLNLPEETEFRRANRQWRVRTDETSIRLSSTPVFDDEKLDQWKKRPDEHRQESVAAWTVEALRTTDYRRLLQASDEKKVIDDLMHKCMTRYAKGNADTRRVLEETFIRKELKSSAKATHRACLALMVAAADSMRK